MTRQGIALVLVASLATACAASSPAPAATDIDRAAVLALEATGLDGTTVRLGTVAASGKPVALVFWQTWCESCLAESPQLARDARTWQDRIEFLGVVPGPDESVNEDDVRRVVAQFGLPYVQVRDRDLSWTRTLRVEGTPTILVIDGAGGVVYRGHRPPADWGAVLQP